MGQRCSLSLEWVGAFASGTAKSAITLSAASRYKSVSNWSWEGVGLAIAI
ncbi:hypothetical protein [Iningainema tapete]|uniref:Uncharacterized protein n=1 Tax=Iningainema tapete BLCC-T55 TaxID=2748662 RepID=A0A8J6XRA7_9CYAN|nr:hypothetical protein [Iningainema tapete]MBD2776920.1 hypothetical protein [Iningainema tapete BLCC-T55]